MLFITISFLLSLVWFSQSYTYDLGTAHVSPGLTAKIYALSRDPPTGDPVSSENYALYSKDSLYLRYETFLTDPNVTYLTTVNGVTDFSISFKDNTNITVYGEKIDATQFIVEARGYFIPPVNGTYYFYNVAYATFDSDNTYIPEYYSSGISLIGKTYITTDDAGDATCNQFDYTIAPTNTYSAALITEGTSAGAFNMGSLIAGRAYPITITSMSLQKALDLSIWFEVGDQTIALDASNFVTMDYDGLDWSDINAVEYPENCPALATTTTYERSVVYSTTTMSTYVTTITGTNGIKTTETVYVVVLPIPGVTPTKSSTSSFVSSSSVVLTSSIVISSSTFSSSILESSSTISSSIPESSSTISSSILSSSSTIISSSIPESSSTISSSILSSSSIIISSSIPESSSTISSSIAESSGTTKSAIKSSARGSNSNEVALSTNVPTGKASLFTSNAVENSSSDVINSIESQSSFNTKSVKSTKSMDSVEISSGSVVLVETSTGDVNPIKRSSSIISAPVKGVSSDISRETKVVSSVNGNSDKNPTSQNTDTAKISSSIAPLTKESSLANGNLGKNSLSTTTRPAIYLSSANFDATSTSGHNRPDLSNTDSISTLSQVGEGYKSHINDITVNPSSRESTYLSSTSGLHEKPTDRISRAAMIVNSNSQDITGTSTKMSRKTGYFTPTTTTGIVSSIATKHMSERKEPNDQSTSSTQKNAISASFMTNSDTSRNTVLDSETAYNGDFKSDSLTASQFVTDNDPGHNTKSLISSSGNVQYSNIVQLDSSDLQSTSAGVSDFAGSSNSLSIGLLGMLSLIVQVLI